MTDIELGNPNHANWLWLVACIVALVLLAAGWNRRAALRFATSEMIDRILPGRSVGRALVTGMLVAASMALLVACIVDMRWGQVQRQIPQQGIEVMFVLDVSRSMLAEDVTPNRLQRAKQMIKDTIDEMAGDRVGLVLFAGEVRQKIPLTSHYGDFKQTLDEVGPHSVNRGGSRLGDAITIANQAFLSQTNEHKAILLLTDGEDQESKPVDAARRARDEHGVRIFTIGLGDLEQGARIPIASASPAGNKPRKNYLQHDGQQVWSKLNGEILAEVAAETGGAYIPAGTKQVNMSDVYHGYIAKIEQKEFETAKIDRLEARFQWFLAPALMLLLIEVALSSWPTPRTGRGDRQVAPNRAESNEMSRERQDAA
jgi:Ca-activated chloride channel family protein